LAYSTNYYGIQAASNNFGNGGMTATPNPVTTGPAPTVPGIPRSLFITANTNAVGGTYGFTCPDSGTLPITVHWGLSAPNAATLVTSGTFPCYTYSDSTSFSQNSNGYYAHFAYATNASGTPSATVSESRVFDYAPCVAATSMAGRVTGLAINYNGHHGEFTWEAPPEAGTYRYSYSVNGQGGTTTSNNVTSVYLSTLTAGTTYTIVIYAQKYCPSTGLYIEGAGGTASFTTGTTAVNSYWCRQDNNCTGTCTNLSASSTNLTNYSTINCNYGPSGTAYPACTATQPATCTGNLGCCSVATKYICNAYDIANLPGACYSGQNSCDSPGNTYGGFTNRAACCPSAGLCGDN